MKQSRGLGCGGIVLISIILLLISSISIAGFRFFNGDAVKDEYSTVVRALINDFHYSNEGVYYITEKTIRKDTIMPYIFTPIESGVLSVILETGEGIELSVLMDISEKLDVGDKLSLKIGEDDRYFLSEDGKAVYFKNIK